MITCELVEVTGKVCVHFTKVPIDVGYGGMMCLWCLFRMPHGVMQREVGVMSIHVDDWDVLLMMR